jgi:predicted transcriptional regulator
VTESQRLQTRGPGAPAWTLLSNHGHVLVCLALDSEMRMRDIAAQVGVTERAVQMIIHDLTEAGLVVAAKVGRRNSYALNRSQRFRHPLEAHVQIGSFVDLVRGSRT